MLKKKQQVTRFVTTILLSLFIFSVSFSNGYAKTLKIGVVESHVILKKSLLTKDIQRQIDAKKIAFGKDDETKGKKLQAMQKSLKKKQSVLSQKAFSQEVMKYQQSVQQFQISQQKKQAIISQAGAKGQQLFEKKMAEAVAVVAKKEGYSLILVKETVPFADMETVQSVTSKVLSIMNAKSKKAGNLFK